MWGDVLNRKWGPYCTHTVQKYCLLLFSAATQLVQKYCLLLFSPTTQLAQKYCLLLFSPTTQLVQKYCLLLFSAQPTKMCLETDDPLTRHILELPRNKCFLCLIIHTQSLHNRIHKFYVCASSIHHPSIHPSIFFIKKR